MMRKQFWLVGLLLIVAVLLFACGPQVAPTPETIIKYETVVVEKDGETIIETVEVVVTTTPVPAAEEDAGEEAPRF